MVTNLRTNGDWDVFCSFQSKQNPCYFLSRSSWDRYKQKYRKAWELDPNFRGKVYFELFPFYHVFHINLFSFTVSSFVHFHCIVLVVSLLENSFLFWANSLSIFSLMSTFWNYCWVFWGFWVTLNWREGEWWSSVFCRWNLATIM